MIPPPTTTTRARDGRPVSATGHLLQQPAEARPPEGRVGLVPPLAPPALEVEVEWAGGSLDEAPQRPAVLAAQHLQPHPRHVRTGRRAEVGLGVRLDLVGSEVALGGGVAELEARVVVAGVLVVD